MIASLLVPAVLSMQPAAQPATKPAEARHPLITEVLYAVPKDCDADQDGRRSATGDEFIELINPHDTPINLKGYKLADAKKGIPPDRKGKGDAPSKSAAKLDKDNRFSFTFPDLTLLPGEVVVVFNGYESSPAAPCGTKDAAAKKNPKFHDAYVFSAQVRSQYIAFANNGDCIALYDPDGNSVECIHWGENQKFEPAPRTSQLPEARASVQRSSAEGGFARHTELSGDDAGELMSPGRFRLAKTTTTAPARPPAAPPSSSSPASTPTPKK